MQNIIRRFFILQVVTLFIPIALVMIGLASYVYYSEKNKEITIASAYESAVVQIGKKTIERTLDLVGNDTLYMSKLPDFNAYIDVPASENLHTLIEDFILMMKSRAVYDQIRWIDETGMEKFRINYNNGKPTVVPRNKLQYKGNRYYFTEALNLSKNEIYYSPFDLNMENNKIEIPRKPTIRAATVLIHNKAAKRGIFIVNYLGSELIDRFISNTKISAGIPLLIDNKGYWIKGTKPSDEWGFMYKRDDLTMMHRYPSEWARIIKKKDGQFENESGLWTFATIYPLEFSQLSSLRMDERFKASRDLKQQHNYLWKTVTFVPHEILYAKFNSFLSILKLITVLGLVLAWIGSWIVVYLYRKKQESQESVKVSERKYKTLVENAMVGIYRSDISGNLLYVNQTFAKMFGYGSPNDLIGQKSMFVYSDVNQRIQLIQKLSEEHSISNYELDLLDCQSNPLPVVISATLEGNVLSGMIIDMREIKKSRKEIEQLSKAIEQIGDTVAITDKYGIITYVNQAFCNQTGYTRAEVIGQNPRILKSNRYDNVFYKRLWATILHGDVFRETIINRKKNGDLYYEDKTITPLKDDKNNIVSFVSTGKDVTLESIMNQEIQRIATTDNLTGIYNRHKFEELFILENERSRRFSQPLSLILIDIDHFKSVNDAYGHDTGDEVLKTLVNIVQENIRQIDIFARWGGEEFLVLCPSTDLDNIKVLAEKLRAAVESSVFPKINHITISIGISTLKEKDTFSKLFKRADQGLYYAKEHGRNQVGAI